MILESEKIILRPISETDIESYFKWHSDNEIRFQAIMHPYLITERIEKEWFDKTINDKSNKRYVFTVISKEDDTIIGYFQLVDVDFINRNAMLGIIIGEKKYQGRGYGKQILTLGLNFGFNSLGLLKISLDVLENNENAIELYKKLGFKQEGFFEKEYLFNGCLYNVKRFAVFNTNKKSF